MNDHWGTDDDSAETGFLPGHVGYQHSDPGSSHGAGAPGEGRQAGAADVTGDLGEPATAEDSGRAQGPGEGGEQSAGSPRRPKRKAVSRSWWIEFPVLLVLALVLALIIKSFVVQAFYIPSSSMENTLDIGDKVLVNKLVYHFRPISRGDVVVFNGDGSWNTVPVQPKPPLVRLWDSMSSLFGTAPGVHDYIKRVIGVPGDHVVCCDAQGRITVNGAPLNEKSYLYPGNPPSQEKFSVTVPRGRLWVMGDHRDVSFDSREHRQYPGNGAIPENHVVGRAFVIIIPLNRWRILPIPATFEQRRLASMGSAALATGSGPGGRAIPAALASPGAPISPAAPLSPLVLGFAGAVPLTWLQRRLRLRLQRSLRRWRGTRMRPRF